MTKRTNLFPSLIKTREMNCLKIAGASLLLLCISPQFAVADGFKQDAVTIMQQQNLKVSGVVTDEAGEPLIGVSVLVKGTTRKHHRSERPVLFGCSGREHFGNFLYWL